MSRMVRPGEEVELREGKDILDVDKRQCKEVLFFVGEEEVDFDWRNQCQRGSVTDTVVACAFYGRVYKVIFAGKDLAFGDKFTVVSIDN